MDVDKRVTPARLDLAAAHLEGKVTAATIRRRARGASCARCRRSACRRPTDTAGLQTQLLFGEGFTIYEEKHGWVWGQAALDGYVNGQGRSL